MKVVVRVDASSQIGSGHVMRCLALADALRDETNADIGFVCRQLPGDLTAYVEACGYTVHRLPQEQIENSGNCWQIDAELTSEAVNVAAADWLIVDHYGLERAWEQRIRSLGARRVMAIDDLGRSHDADVLLDQNYCDGMVIRYEHAIPAHCQSLIGPSYALLRPEFACMRARLPLRRGKFDRILVFFGGSDPGNETAKALAGLAGIAEPAFDVVDVVVGASNPNKDEIRAFCATQPRFRYHCQVNNMAELMAQADLAFGAGGITTWERCCLGLPALVTVLADNQAGSAEAVAEFGAIVNLGRAEDIVAADYQRAVTSLTPADLAGMSERGMSLIDGEGCRRVVATFREFGK